MRNLKIEIEYDGSRYKGWQTQKGNIATIQEKLESVIAKMTKEEIQVIGCGRTDTGVHAENYIANFTTNCEKTVEEMLDYLCEYLPEDIVVKAMKDTSERFHARYNVISKTYVYRINNNKYRNVFNKKYTCHIPEKLDIEQMQKAAAILVGTHDFMSFTTLKNKSKATVRTINYINIRENDGNIEMEFNGNGFLKNMVRIITGTLIEIGLGTKKFEDMKKVLEAKQRSEAGPTAHAHGLALKNVQY
ncbi:tRNA pseudouridine(38-40) synthase TruA [Clostridium gasigenes]|uniref:tRNA pseudouridine(38-40) synthase TruA n=1 Tax=Clostridium gasigenes TaxID=94869 RepID=UPI001C0AFFCE|nr:tRNA pseudouridine(38-40) synthase TruA [Clostridium gasigenes]MBU3102781.1 tRNA pseudouridine(38-40) synthase TruA [Clostridium gasigenes]